MSDDIERELREALADAASSAVGDHRQPPPFRPDLPSRHATPSPHRRHGWLAPLLAAAAVVAVVAGTVTAASVLSQRRTPAAGPRVPSRPAPSGVAILPTAPAATLPRSGPPAVAPPASAAAGRVIRVHSVEGDGSIWGIGMPIVLQFSVAPTDVTAFAEAAKVTVNGQPAHGAWFWEKSTAPGMAVEAHYRTQSFWPGHATIRVQLPIGGLSAGPGLVYGDALTSVTFHTGAATVGRVDGRTSQLTITSDGRQVGPFPVSLGAPQTPTMDGTKLVLDKVRDERMAGSGYDEIVPWAMRLTDSGEYLHAAPWNTANIEARRPTTNGCTNLLPADAAKVFSMMLHGDPVIYTNMPGNNVRTMPSSDGYGDWNVPWPQWQAGGLY